MRRELEYCETFAKFSDIERVAERKTAMKIVLPYSSLPYTYTSKMNISSFAKAEVRCQPLYSHT